MTQNPLTPAQQAEAARLHSDVLMLALSDEGLAASALDPLLARQMAEITLRSRRAISGDLSEPDPRAVAASAMQISPDDFARLVAVRRRYKTLIASGKRQKSLQASSGAPEQPRRRTLTERVRAVRMYPPRY
jgi:hypothetical protein